MGISTCKKTLCLLIVLLTLLNNSFAQKMEFGLAFNPTFSSSRVKTIERLAFIYDGEKRRYGYEVGIIARRELNSFFILESGIKYTVMGFSYGKQTLYNDDYSVKSIEESFQRYDFVNVPFKLSIVPKPKTMFSPVLDIGINNYLFLTERFGTNNNNYVIQNSDVNTYQLGLVAGLGARVMVDNRYNFYLRSNFNYQLSSVYDSNAPTKRNLYSIGAELTIAYQFR